MAVEKLALLRAQGARVETHITHHGLTPVHWWSLIGGGEG
jgi:hypothetical protein